MATSTGAAPTTEDAGTHKRDKVRLVVEIVGALVAIGALLFGFMQKSEATNANTTVTSQQQTINNYGLASTSLQSAYDVATSSIGVLATQNSSLSVAIASMSSQLATRPTGPATTSSGPTALSLQTPAAPSTFHQGPLSIAQNGEELDLDAPAQVRSWSVQAGGKTDLDYALGNEPFLQPRNGAAFALLDSTEANYDSCSGPLAYNSGDGNALLLSRAKPGVNLCVKTSDKRYSALRVVSADKTQMTFNVTTFDPPFS